MASVQLNSYEGRTAILDVYESSVGVDSSNVHWTFTSTGGYDKYYTMYNINGWVNGNHVVNYGTVYYTSGVFPAATGSISGDISVGRGSNSIGFTLQGKVYISGTETHNGSIGITRPAKTGSVTGRTIGDKFKVAYTKYDSYSYKLRISIPNVAMLERIDYNTSNAEFSLSQASINELIRRYPNNTSFSLGFAVETYSGSNKRCDGNETTITATIKKPTLSNISATSITRTGATISFNIDSVVDISGRGIQISLDKSTNLYDLPLSSNSAVINILQANTKYYYRIYATNKGGTTYSDWQEFTTIGNAPSLVNPYTTLTIGNAFVDCGQISYDTNASLKTRVLEYKKSSESNYSTSGDGFNFTTQNNTNYDYKLTITDNFNRSSNVTGTFKSAGNLPTVNFSPIEITPTKATLGILYTFDNTIFNSGTYSLKMGSTVIESGNLPSPGLPIPGSGTPGIDIPIPKTFVNLKPNTEYTISGTLTDSADNTTNYTYTFKTKPGIKINTMVAVEFKVDGQIVKGLRLNGIDLF